MFYEFSFPFHKLWSIDQVVVKKYFKWYPQKGYGEEKRGVIPMETLQGIVCMIMFFDCLYLSYIWGKESI